MKNTSIIRLTVLGLFSSSLVGCAAAQVQMSKGNLDVRTKMSATLFVDPPNSESEKTFFLQVKNSSDKEFEIAENLRQALMAKGYRAVANPRQAHYILQANVLQVGKFAPTAAEAAVYGGSYRAGDMMTEAASIPGTASGGLLTGVGLLGDTASLVADSVVKDVYFSAVTDVQIKERLGKGIKADQTSMHFNQNGTSGHTVSYLNEKSDWKISQTRILSSANKVNLQFETAAPELKKALVQSIASVF